MQCTESKSQQFRLNSTFQMKMYFPYAAKNHISISEYDAHTHTHMHTMKPPLRISKMCCFAPMPRSQPQLPTLPSLCSKQLTRSVSTGYLVLVTGIMPLLLMQLTIKGYILCIDSLSITFFPVCFFLHSG